MLGQSITNQIIHEECANFSCLFQIPNFIRLTNNKCTQNSGFLLKMSKMLLKIMKIHYRYNQSINTINQNDLQLFIFFINILFFFYFLRYELWKRVMVGSGRASSLFQAIKPVPKDSIQMYLIFFSRSYKDFRAVAFLSRRSSYTINRNFVHFAPSLL